MTININGRIRTISSIVNNTQMILSQPMDFTDSNLRYKTHPRGTISVIAGSNIVTVATTSSQTIDGSTTASLKVQNISVDLISDGANWKII